jgi:oxygen-dependent protoporphyrinogen oxidase
VPVQLSYDVVVVGGGLAGLTAAHLLAASGTSVLVLESSPQTGGKLRVADVGGVTVDVGAEAMLSRRPEGVDLARDLGLEVVHPSSGSAQLWTRGALRPLPRTLLGVPLDLPALERSGVLSPEGLARAESEVDLPVPRDDLSVADLLGSRLGHEVVDRLAEPLLGGVYAGRSAELSARATMPQVMSLLTAHGSLTAAAAALPEAPPGPVFAGIVGGLARLPETLADGPFIVRTDATVRAIERTPDGFRLVVGSTREPEEVTARQVVVATPAAPAARLLASVAATAGAELAAIEYASMAIVTLAVPTFEAGDSSGFLVPPVDGRRIKGATYSFNKWAWVGDAGGDLRLLRASLGRHREESTLQVEDGELVAAAVADLAEATGQPVTPVDSHVQRWGGGLPQYAVGHLDRVARIRADVARVPGLAVCGAAYDGVGIPAVIASAHRAVADLRQGTMNT